MDNSRAVQRSHPPIQHNKWKKFLFRRFSLWHHKDPEGLTKCGKETTETEKKKKKMEKEENTEAARSATQPQLPPSKTVPNSHRK